MSYWTVPSKELAKMKYNRMSHATQFIEDVCNFYGLSKAELVGKRRQRHIVKARYIAIYLIRKRTDLTLSAIGHIFHRDHTTVIYAVQTIEEVLSLKYENDFQDEIKKVLLLF